MNESEASVQTSILNGEFVVFKATNGSTSIWYYPTEINNGNIIMFSLVYMSGNASIDALISNGNGILSWLSLQND